MKFKQILGISKAYSFISYLLPKLKEKITYINGIYLFGSYVRGDIKSDSDIDIYIDSKEDIEKDVEKIVNEFEKSFFGKYYENLGLFSPISVKVGVLKEEKDLRDSILSNGIILYSKAIPEKYKVGYIFYFKKLNKKEKFHRKIFGYKYRGKKYPGLIDKGGIKKLSSNCYLVYPEVYHEFVNVLKDCGIRFNILKVLLPK